MRVNICLLRNNEYKIARSFSTNVAICDLLRLYSICLGSTGWILISRLHERGEGGGLDSVTTRQGFMIQGSLSDRDI